MKYLIGRLRALPSLGFNLHSAEILWEALRGPPTAPDYGSEEYLPRTKLATFNAQVDRFTLLAARVSMREQYDALCTRLWNRRADALPDPIETS